MIFTNGRLILADGISDGLEVVVTNGRIDEIRARSVNPDAIDLEKNYLAPGFIDLHIHGAVGRDAMEASEEAFRAICNYHASGGTTSLLLTTVSAPIPKLVEVLSAARKAKTIPQLAGVHIEGPFISRIKCGAQAEAFIRNPDNDSVGQLLGFSDVIKRITVAPEIAGALDLIDRCREKNIAVSGGNSDASDEEARVAFVHGMRHITHAFNAMSSARRRGVYREAGLLEFGLSEPEIMCELIADGHHVRPTLVKMLYRAKGLAGICLVTDATAGAGLEDGSRFFLCDRECVVQGGVCLLANGSALAGSASRMIDLVRFLVNTVGIPLHEAMRMATANPARALGSTTKGKLEPGADADFIVLSPELEVLQTFVKGEQVF